MRKLKGLEDFIGALRPIRLNAFKCGLLGQGKLTHSIPLLQA